MAGKVLAAMFFPPHPYIVAPSSATINITEAAYLMMTSNKFLSNT